MDEDVRDQTRENRLRIGFSQPETWRNAPAYFDTHTLTIEGHPVMEDWEESYMRELADIATSKGGAVLEVGFGMGISANFIQMSEIREHLIVEMNQDVHARALTFAKNARIPTRVLLGMWEEVTPLLESSSIDGILFDTYPLTADEIHRNHFRFFSEAYRLLGPNGILTYYSDETDDFSSEHREAIIASGFRRIEKRICRVSPPPNCLYWTSPTIVAPIIQK